jgi:MYXO-CTERM domain-containing protein
MSAGSAGEKSATLVLEWDSGSMTGSTSIPLSGSDVSETSDKDRDTFYACATSSGGGAGGWPVVAAFGVCVIAWRRRRG